MTDIFQLVRSTNILKTDSYIISYKHIAEYMSSIGEFSEREFVCCAHIVYGWMPTILEINSKDPSLSLQEGALLLNIAKTRRLEKMEIEILARLINNSVVGASKLLHFVSPDKHAIWDSRVYAFLHKRRPYNYLVNNSENYFKYLGSLDRHLMDQRFCEFHQSVNGKIGYEVSALRAAELIMFLNSPVVAN